MRYPVRKTRLVYLHWRDACMTRDDPPALVVNVNIGWIVEQNAVHVVLEHGWSTSGQTDKLVVPAGDVIKIVTIFSKER